MQSAWWTIGPRRHDLLQSVHEHHQRRIGAAIQAAHARKLKLTGIFVRSRGRKQSRWESMIWSTAGVCGHRIRGGQKARRVRAGRSRGLGETRREWAAVQALIQNLVSHHVAVTSICRCLKPAFGTAEIAEARAGCMVAESAQSY